MEKLVAGCYNKYKFPERKGAGTYEGMEKNHYGYYAVILYGVTGGRSNGICQNPKSYDESGRSKNAV